MKKIKRITAFVSAVLITANCSNAKIFAEEIKNDDSLKSEKDHSQNNTQVTINWWQLSELRKIKIENKIYDGNTNAVIDFSPLGCSSAEEVKIPGVAEDDDVQLTAEAYFDSPEAGKSKNVKVIFGFKGDDLYKYRIDNSTYEINKSADISRADVKIIPDSHENSVFVGESVPSEVGFSTESDTTVETDMSAMTLSPDCRDSSNSGKYSYSINKNGQNLNNYDFKISGSFYINVRPKISFKSIETSEEGEVTGRIVTVKAPKDKNGNVLYYVGNSKDDTDESVDLKISDDNMIQFCISRPDNADDISYVQYKLNLDAYDLENASESIAFKDGNSVKYVSLKDDKGNECDRFITSNSGFDITVKIQGSEVYQNNAVVLNSGEDSYDGVLKDSVFDEKTGLYSYIYTFDINDVKDEDEKRYKFTLLVKDEFGNQNSKELGFIDSSSTDSVKDIVVDKKNPKVGKVVINYINKHFSYNKSGVDFTSGGYFIADGNVVDTGSGIAKIEYKWDDDIEPSEFFEYGSDWDKNKKCRFDSKGRMIIESDKCNDYYTDKTFNSFNKSYDTPFQILVPYTESKSNGTRWQHALILKLTDNAGNSVEIDPSYYLDGTTFQDTMPPVVTSVKMSGDKEIRCLPSGNYSKGDIIFEISAKDESESDRCLGIKEYYILSSENKLNEDIIDINSGWINRYEAFGYYDIIEEKNLLSISENDKMFDNTFIAVFDKSRAKKYYLTDLKEYEDLKNVESNIILIDTFLPSVTPNFSQGKKVDDGIVWFKDGALVIIADDTNPSGDASGIYSISVSDSETNDNIVIDNKGKSDRIIKDNYSIKMSEIDEGIHTYYYYAEDNAGNRSDKQTVEFGYDKGAPKCSFEAVDPVYGDCWFRQEDNFEVKIDFSDSLSGIDRNTVCVTVNGEKIDFDDSCISEDENRLTYTLSKDKHLKNISLSDQCYHIEVNALDKAGNSLDTNSVNSFDVHLDCFSPWIKDMTVSKTDSSDEEKRINILPNGIYANTGVQLEVSAFDSDSANREKTEQSYNANESQIKSVIIRYKDTDNTTDTANYVEEELEPVLNKENSFTVNIPLPEKGTAFKKEFTLTVCDNTGRKCSTDYVIRAVEGKNENSGTDDILEISEEKYIDLVIEEIAPTVDIIIPQPHYTEKGSDSDKYWFSEDVSEEIKFSIIDNESGLNNVTIREYREENDKGTVLQKDDSDAPNEILSREISEKTTIDCEVHEYIFKTSENHSEENISGRHIYEAAAEDNSGNKSEPVTYEYYIDNQNPVITGAGFPSKNESDDQKNEKLIPAESFTQNPADVPYYNVFYKNGFTAKIYPDDPDKYKDGSSGLREMTFRLISGEEESELITEKILTDENGRKYAPVNIPDDFKGRIGVEVFDNVGNRSGFYTLESAVISEDEKPDIDISFTDSANHKDSDGNALYTEDAPVKVVLKDSKSGLKEWKINITSEKTGYDNQSVITQVTEGEHNVGDEIGDGWKIEEMDANLITAVSRTFVFASDDNDISVEVEAEDNCGNSDIKASEKFTVDKTAPVINIKVSEGLNGTEYYNAEKKAEISVSVTERNFDPSLIKTDIKNTYGSDVPVITFEDDPDNKSLHTAVLHFGEGDYTFDIKGEDLAGYNAEVNKPYEGVKKIYVDETSPKITTNFDSFGSPEESLYYREGKKAKITVVEHNFDPTLTGLKVLKKSAGSSHDQSGFSDETGLFVSYSDWKQDPSNSDIHTLEFETEADAVYRLEINASDKAGNKPVYNNSRSDTEVYEIDTRVPEVTNKNGSSVSGEKNELEFLDIYTPERADAEAPSVEFEDINFDHISYTVKKYVPKYNKNNELGTIEPEEYTEDISDRKFVLKDFNDDGIYYTEIYAYDKAGNRSLLNKNTYVRMMDRDILAFIPDSSIEKKSGLYSFEYEDGSPISKRPDDFEDISITIMSVSSTAPKIVLRDLNGDETDTNLVPESINEEMYGIKIYSYVLKSEFFKKNYQNDTDKELILTVKDNSERMDLGKIHIDNVKPEVKIPSDLKSWKWYPGKKERVIVLTDISEILESDACKVYDNNAEIPFTYSAEDGTLSFTLNKGWHNIGIHLVDTAGNVYDIQEAENICVGHFWTWIIGGGTAAAAAVVGLVLFKKKKRRKNHYR